VPSFQATAAVLGVVLVASALVSGLAERSFLSLASLFVLVGLLLGDGGLKWLDFRSHSGFVTDLAFAALIAILFRDGLEVDGEMLQREWRLSARKLVLAMPITAGVVAVAARLLFGRSWIESLLLGALLSPTDPVLTPEHRHQPPCAAAVLCSIVIHGASDTPGANWIARRARQVDPCTAARGGG
jgi:NhaP-type Na+/H+ or K+/H+ antiporter